MLRYPSTHTSWMRTRYQYIPSGVFVLKIVAWGINGLQKSWSDGKTATIETYLNEFVVGLLKVAEAAKARRLRQEQEEHARREAQRKREEDIRKWQEELASRQWLEEDAANWAKAQQLCAYLAARNEMLIAMHGEIDPGSQANQWRIWAYQHADRLDPLVNG